jgi:hypothetical protein
MRVRLTAFAVSTFVLLSAGLVMVIVTVASGPVTADAPSLPATDGGIAPCVPGADRNLLSVDALQCWFQAHAGRWRILSRVSTQGVLIVEAEAAAIDDAEEIAERFVASEAGRFLEIMVYVQGETTGASTRIRRIHWTPRDGFDALEFDGAPAS